MNPAGRREFWMKPSKFTVPVLGSLEELANPLRRSVVADPMPRALRRVSIRRRWARALCG